MIEIRAVHKEFAKGERRVVALEEIDLTVAEREFVAILGPSGCGKSTLLNMVAGFDLPTRGSVKVAGEEILAPAPTRGVVFQEPALFPWLTVMDNVVFGPKTRGQSAADYRARAAQIIEAVGLSGFEASYPAELSGGMRQRVGIARALAVRPAILLMDEPLSALDSQTRELLMEDFIRLLADGSMGAVYITHNLEEAVRLADRVVVLSRRPGRIREIVTIPITRAARGGIDARGKLLSLQNQLWSLIRDEAIDAEREVQHA